MFGRLKIGTKILAVTGTIAVSVIAAIGLVSDFSTRNAFEADAYKKLTAVREMKGQQIESYFNQVKNSVQLLSKSADVRTAITDFNNGIIYLTPYRNPNVETYYRDNFFKRYTENKGEIITAVNITTIIPTDLITRHLQAFYIMNEPHMVGPDDQDKTVGHMEYYNLIHQKYHPVFNDYLERFGFYDFFLINATDGRIVYSVFKEVDYATSLLTGPYKDTNLARAFRAAREASDPNFVKFVDFEPYVPSYGAPAAFITAPVFDQDKVVGVLAFQMPVDRINDIMTSNQQWSKVGLGESGETYLVGEDKLLRNQSRFFIEDRENYFDMITRIGLAPSTISKIRALDTTIGLQIVDTEGTAAALAGETGVALFEDYRGVPVFSSFRPLKLPDLDWVIMSEIDEAEAFAPFDDLRDRMIMLASVLIAITIFISYFFSLSLTRPLRLLEGAAKGLSLGQLDQPIERASGDEIGDLAEDFEGMRVALQHSFDEVEHQKEGLEIRVQERTAELDRAINKQAEQNLKLEDKNVQLQAFQNELIASKVAADEANKAKSTFLLNMSHELRTPMNAIIGYAEMLAEDADEDDDEDRLSDIKKIIDSAKHLLALINDVLDISKIESGTMGLDLETFDLEMMVRDVASTTKALIEKNDNVLAMDIDDDIGEAYADLTKVRQILLNMVSNAAKFTSNGTITLFAKRYTEGEQDNLRLGVSDTGIGIPEDMLSEIFEEFTQADDSTTRSFGGTGLGLALVRRFCQMMGGNVWAESVVGEGSSFIMDIPAIVIDQDAVAAVPESSSATLLTEPVEPLDTPTND